MITNVPKPEIFEKTCEKIFHNLINDYDYTLIKIERPFEHHSEIYYENKFIGRIVQISNSPYYTNYGFSIFISNNKNETEKILLYNLPWEKEDPNCDFVISCHKQIFQDNEVIEIINGTKWNKSLRPWKKFDN